MNPSTFAPLGFFFTAFVLAFTLIELLVIFFVNRLIARHWIFVVDVLVRTGVRHPVAMRLAVAVLVGLPLVFLAAATPIVPVLRAATPPVRLLAAGLFAVILPLYFFSTRHASRTGLERRVHRYIYFFLSLVFWVFLVLTADRTYERYQLAVQSGLLAPFHREVDTARETLYKSGLLAQMRSQFQQNKCVPAGDFFSKNSLRQFVYAGTDAQMPSTDDPVTELFAGTLCSSDGQTFIRTTHGDWYWILP